MKTNTTYNKSEVIDVKFNTWVDANIHLPEIVDKENHKTAGHYPFIYLKSDYLSKDKDERQNAIYQLKEIIKEVKEMDGRELSLDEALEYCEKHSVYGYSKDVLFYLKINGPKIVKANISQTEHNDFNLWCSELEIMGFGKIQGKLKIAKNPYYKGYEILKWTPLPDKNDANWFTGKSKPKNVSRLIALAGEDNDYKILYYIDNKFISIEEGEEIKVKKWMYLPEVLNDELNDELDNNKVIKVKTCGSCPFINAGEDWDSSCTLDKTITMPYSGDFNIDSSVHEKCPLRTQTVEVKLK